MADKYFYGGQAVIEGVMMRGRKNMVTAVRSPDGSLIYDAQVLSSIFTGRWRKMPLVRGVIVLIESLALGIKTLMFSANVSLEEQGGEKMSAGMMTLVLIISLAFAVGVFFIAPLFLTRFINSYINQSTILFNLIEGLMRLAIFLIYLRVVTLMPDIRRVFAYHGAEHKAVNAYEAGVPLEVENVQRYSTAHVRCGTSFLLVVLIIAIVVFSLVGKPSLQIMVLSRIFLIPVIVALGYEFTYFGARHNKSWLMKVLMTPGLWLQSFTTRQPDNSQVEVAISALKRVIEIDEAEPVAATAVVQQTAS